MSQEYISQNTARAPLGVTEDFGLETVTLQASVEPFDIHGAEAAGSRQTAAQSLDAVEPAAGAEQGHFLSEADARRLGLTAIDRIRYKWTGELPEGTEILNDRTLRDQRQYDHFFGRNTAEQVPEQVVYRGLPPEQLSAMEYPQFKAWALMEIAGLARQVKEALADPAKSDLIGRIQERARAWQQTYYARYWPEDEADSDKDLKTLVAEYQALIRPIINSKALPAASKAELIEAVVLGYRPVTDECVVEREMITELQAGNTEICARLITMQASGHWAAGALNCVLHFANEAELGNLARSMTVPLARHMQQRCTGRLYDASRAISSLNFMLYSLESKIRASGRTEAMESVGRQMHQAADIVGDALSLHARSVRIEHVSHGLASDCVRLLGKLYFSEFSQHGRPTPQLAGFLRELFNFKFEPYRYNYDVGEMSANFDRLAAGCGLETSCRLGRR